MYVYKFTEIVAAPSNIQSAWSLALTHNHHQQHHHHHQPASSDIISCRFISSTPTYPNRSRFLPLILSACKQPVNPVAAPGSSLISPIGAWGAPPKCSQVLRITGRSPFRPTPPPPRPTPCDITLPSHVD